MAIDIRDPAVERIFKLMVPVTIGLGLININALIDQLFATHFLDPNEAPAAIVRAFRLYMLPQGVFSVAVATVLFPLAVATCVAPGLERVPEHRRHRASAHLVPADSGERRGAVLATPIVRLLYQHGNFTAQRHAGSSRRASPHSRWDSRSTGRC